jgi:hypothetical protein
VITREQVEAFFEHTRQLRRDGRVGWDIDGVCRWSYFFVDSSKKKLLLLGEHLRGRGYQVVGVREPGDGDDDPETITLQVDQVERHTVDSLLARNVEFYAAARQFQVRDYDGMDNGPVDGP